MRRQLGKVLDHSRTSLAVGVLGVAATVATFVLADAGTSAKRSGLTRSPSALTSPHRQSSRPAIPLLSGNASCNDLRQSALQTRGDTAVHRQSRPNRRRNRRAKSAPTA